MNNDTSYSVLFSKPDKANRDLLTRREAAEYLGVTEGTLAVWASVKRYGLPYVKMGRLAKYRRTDLDAFITKRTITQHEL